MYFYIDLFLLGVLISPHALHHAMNIVCMGGLIYNEL